jgi:hypothetical protein
LPICPGCLPFWRQRPGRLTRRRRADGLNKLLQTLRPAPAGRAPMD